jgi:hypothetical protein
MQNANHKSTAIFSYILVFGYSMRRMHGSCKVSIAGGFDALRIQPTYSRAKYQQNEVSVNKIGDAFPGWSIILLL